MSTILYTKVYYIYIAYAIVRRTAVVELNSDYPNQMAATVCALRQRRLAELFLI